MKTCQISYISTTEGNPKWQNGWLRDIVVVYNLFFKKNQGKIPKPVVWIQARAIAKTSLSPYKFTTAYHVWRPLIVSTIPCSNTRHKALPTQLGLFAFLNWKFRNVLLSGSVKTLKLVPSVSEARRDIPIFLGNTYYIDGSFWNVWWVSRSSWYLNRLHDKKHWNVSTASLQSLQKTTNLNVLDFDHLWIPLDTPSVTIFFFFFLKFWDVFLFLLW